MPLHCQGALGPAVIVACSASIVSLITIGPATDAVPVLVTSTSNEHSPEGVQDVAFASFTTLSSPGAVGGA